MVAALGDLKRRGRRFNFLAMCGGDPAGIARFSEAIVEAGIEAETRRLPFLAHWHVPGFLRALTAACFLEHRFPIAAHGPGIPQEVLSVGVPSAALGDRVRGALAATVPARIGASGRLAEVATLHKNPSRDPQRRLVGRTSANYSSDEESRNE